MSVRDVLGVDPLTYAVEKIADPGDMKRRKDAQRRVDLYLDNSQRHVREEIHSIFQEPAVQQRLEPFIKMAASQSLVKRVVNDISRPVYATPPRRVVTPTTDQVRFNALAEECRLNEKMDLACRLANACNTAWLYPRFTERLGIVLDVLTPNMVTVIPDPEDPTRELALIYDKPVRIDGKDHLAHVFWDDTVAFTFLADGTMLGEGTIEHGLGRLPFVPVHATPRWGSYYDTTTGEDMVGGHMAASLLTVLVLKLHKSQGEKQIVVTGDVMGGFPKDQILDGEGALVAGEGTNITTLDLQSSASHYRDSIESIIGRVAANHGINRDRLDAKPGDDVGLLERRADSIKVMWKAEQDLFEVLKIVSREHPAYRLSDDAKIEVDFGEIHHRVDRMSLLKIREEEERKGYRTVLDDIMEDQPEIATEEEARKEYLKNLQIRSWRVEQERALNMPHDPDTDGPGLDPEANGALGPEVRDGDMSAEDAEDKATGRAGDPASE